MESSARILVIGGSAAGPKAAARARRLEQNASITIIQKAPDLSMASCGYPYYVGGFFNERSDLLSTPTGVVRDAAFFRNAKGITARTETEAVSIDRAARTVRVRDLKTGTEETLPYDRLIIATGSTPRVPPLPGRDLKGITTLQSMQDADFLKKVCSEKKVSKAVVIGGGLIGVEASEALSRSGISVTVIEMLPQILTFLDFEMALLAGNYLASQGVDILTDNAAAEFLGNGTTLTGLRLQDGTQIPCELAVIAVGVAPNSALARAAGLEVGEKGGITVNDYLQTSDPLIYAAGDCIEVTGRLTGSKTLAPYGDLANLQGRVAGQNAALGNHSKFPGTIQTGICKMFDFTAGATGISAKSARAAGFETAVSVIATGPDKPHFMQGKPLITKITADADSRKLLGVQCVGQGDVSRLLSQAAMAIQGGLTLEELAVADQPYAPPFSPAIDNLITAVHVLQNRIDGRMKGISAAGVKRRTDSGEKLFLLDVRSPQEYEEMRLGIGETLIPLGALRSRLSELPDDKSREIVCYCKISLRGYEAARILEAAGWHNVTVLEGGIAAWPYAREK